MDALKAVLAAKRKAQEEAFQGKKFLKRSELEQLQIKKLKEEEEKERAAKVGASASAACSLQYTLLLFAYNLRRTQRHSARHEYAPPGMRCWVCWPTCSSLARRRPSVSSMSSRLATRHPETRRRAPPAARPAAARAPTRALAMPLPPPSRRRR
jgi:hypothetical protein